MENENVPPEPPLELRGCIPQIDPQTGNVVVTFFDKNEDWFAIAVERQLMRDFVGRLVEFTTKLQVDDVPIAPSPTAQANSPQLAATETALLHATSAKVARWEKGGAVLLATTASGVAVQLAMGRGLAESVGRALLAKK